MHGFICDPDWLDIHAGIQVKISQLVLSGYWVSHKTHTPVAWFQRVATSTYDFHRWPWPSTVEFVIPMWKPWFSLLTINHHKGLHICTSAPCCSILWFYHLPISTIMNHGQHSAPHNSCRVRTWQMGRIRSMSWRHESWWREWCIVSWWLMIVENQFWWLTVWLWLWLTIFVNGIINHYYS